MNNGYSSKASPSSLFPLFRRFLKHLGLITRRFRREPLSQERERISPPLSMITARCDDFERKLKGRIGIGSDEASYEKGKGRKQMKGWSRYPGWNAPDATVDQRRKGRWRKREAFKYNGLSGPKRHYAAMSLIIAMRFRGNIATLVSERAGPANARRRRTLRNDVFYFASCAIGVEAER